ncbi:MAG: hypothetical protein C4300_03130, partial [Thermus sp.]
MCGRWWSPSRAGPGWSEDPPIWGMPPALFKGYAEKVQREGFSLLELLVVLLLLGLLLALLPPRLAAP